jgi:hypothetical protein
MAVFGSGSLSGVPRSAWGIASIAFLEHPPSGGRVIAAQGTRLKPGATTDLLARRFISLGNLSAVAQRARILQIPYSICVRPLGFA